MSERVGMLAALLKHRADWGISGRSWHVELDSVIAAAAEMIEFNKKAAAFCESHGHCTNRRWGAAHLQDDGEVVQ